MIKVSDIVLAAIVLIVTIVCAKRGFAMTLYSAFSKLLAVVIAFFLYPFTEKMLLKTGIDRFFEEELALKIISVLTVFLLVTVIMILLKKVFKIFSRIPVVKVFDRAGGILMGLLFSAFWLVIAGLFIRIFSDNAGFAVIISDIENSLVAKYFYNLDFLTNLLLTK